MPAGEYSPAGTAGHFGPVYPLKPTSDIRPDLATAGSELHAQVLHGLGESVVHRLSLRRGPIVLASGCNREVGDYTADAVTAVTTTPAIQQKVANLTDGGTYTFYILGRVPSGTPKVSPAIVNNADAAHLAGPTQVTLRASWQRSKIIGSLANGQTGLRIVERQFAGYGGA